MLVQLAWLSVWAHQQAKLAAAGMQPTRVSSRFPRTLLDAGRVLPDSSFDRTQTALAIRSRQHSCVAPGRSLVTVAQVGTR